MSSRAIRIENVSKRYQLGEKRGISLIRHAVSRKNSSQDDERPDRVLWALKDVSFEVAEGEIVGIIGRNGAGKSTLLKILSRITKPTTGTARITGTVGSLLEVGTGFHPELTGRDNVFLNGAILGMGRTEIRRKFDEIVEFAGVARFIDTPVKHYSSGMQVRLAFAVASQLEPEILLVDEVLSVGDAEFQKRCLGRMEEVGKQGRTILFVSHNMPAVLRICPRVVFIEDGKVVADGPSQHVIRTYLDTGQGTTALRQWGDPAEAPGDDIARLKAVRVLVDDHVSEGVDIRKPVDVEVEYWLLRDDADVCPGVGLYFVNEDGVLLFASTEMASPGWQRPRAKGVTTARCRVPANLLAEGQIMVTVDVSTLHPQKTHIGLEDAVAFQVIDTNEGDSVRGDLTPDWPGVIRPRLDWTITDEPASTPG